ncbi:MAG: thiol:disulfide interchange protein, partial [Rhizobiales bacterium]|nr:thiol:disulfide interchange protein [Hyphomicrobiales bacterium]
MTNDMPDNPPARPASRRLPLLLSAIAAGAIVGYGIVTQWSAMQQKAGGDPDCASTMTLAKKVAPLATGEVAALTIVQKPMKMPDLTFDDGQGNPKKLSDWRGKTVLL